jgi:hypothetical protein
VELDLDIGVDFGELEEKSGILEVERLRDSVSLFYFVFLMQVGDYVFQSAVFGDQFEGCDGPDSVDRVTVVAPTQDAQVHELLVV